jgi:FkbM family methyltransferase
MIAGLKQTVRRYLSKRMRLPEIPVCLDAMAKRGFAPNFIFDVGAYRGDFAREALRVWPTAQIVCFEPQDHVADRIDELRQASGRVELHRCLLGARASDAVTFNLYETGSSVLDEWHTTHEQRSYPQLTIDGIVDGVYNRRAPDLLKLDVQGYELEVLKGAVGSLPGIQAILAEINLIDIHRGAPLLHEMVGWLAENGFVAYEICGLTRRPLDGALWQIDAVFVRANGPLRQDKRWQAERDSITPRLNC